MQQLHEQCRPRSWAEVIGQVKAMKAIDTIRRISGSLAGQNFFLSGKSGTGKTSIARLIAAEISDTTYTQEIHASDVSAEFLRALQDRFQYRPFGGLAHCVIINEAHCLSRVAVGRLLDLLETGREFVSIVFTTTSDGREALFEDNIDAHPLLSRCVVLALAQRDIAGAFAAHVMSIARDRGLDGRPLPEYLKLANSCKSNMREMLSRVQAGEMLAD